jgi:hypothetical protein
MIPVREDSDQSAGAPSTPPSSDRLKGAHARHFSSENGASWQFLGGPERGSTVCSTWNTVAGGPTGG